MVVVKIRVPQWYYSVPNGAVEHILSRTVIVKYHSTSVRCCQGSSKSMKKGFANLPSLVILLGTAVQLIYSTWYFRYPLYPI